MIRICYRCGRKYGSRGDWCEDCGAFLPLSAPADYSSLKMFAWCCAIVAVIFALLALNGCGPAFTAEELSTAGAGGHSQTLPQAGAGGREVSNGGATETDHAGSSNAGTGGRAGAEASAGAPPVGMGGTGGAPNSSRGGAAAGGSGASAATCLIAWRGSSCDTCSSSAPDAGRSCSEVLECYVASGCIRAPCAEACNFAAPTSDAAVREAQRVAACRCGGAP